MSLLAQNLAGVEHKYTALEAAFVVFIRALAATFNSNEHFPSVHVAEPEPEDHVRPVAHLYLLGVRFELAFSVVITADRARGVLQVAMPADPHTPRTVLVYRFFDSAKNVTRALEEAFSHLSLDERDFHAQLIAEVEAAYFAAELAKLPHTPAA